MAGESNDAPETRAEKRGARAWSLRGGNGPQIVAGATRIRMLVPLGSISEKINPHSDRVPAGLARAIGFVSEALADDLAGQCGRGAYKAISGTGASPVQWGEQRGRPVLRAKLGVGNLPWIFGHPVVF